MSRRRPVGDWFRAGLTLVLAHFCLAANAQTGILKPEEATGKRVEPATKASQPSAFSIPVTALSFAAPGPLYLGQRTSFASLDFLDENRLLFTFRVPGLIRREPQPAGSLDPAPDDEERHIRAVLLALPSGAVEAEALWTLHDRAPYLSMLRDGHFLLRDQAQIFKGDATLALKPYLRFPGPVLSVDLDPSQQYIVTNSRESLAPQQLATAEAKAGTVPTPSTAAATVTEAPSSDESKAGAQAGLLMRILRIDTGQVMLFSHLRSPAHLPINGDGYLEQLRGRGMDWTLVLNSFTGGNKVLGQVASNCSPPVEFLSQKEMLATACNAQGGDTLVAMEADGHKLWDAEIPPTETWPRTAVSADGSRLAWETLLLPYAVNANSPIGSEDIKGQRVRVYDAADGKLELTAPASPVLDAGGNVAISPSGRRVAILDGGAIQVYELPASPPLTESGANQSGGNQSSRP
jgi:hypothetical protein